MTTQNEILGFLKSNYNVQSVDGSTATLLVEWNDGRSQLVFVTIGEAVVTIASPAARVSDVNLENFVKVVSQTTPYGVRIIGDFVTVANAGLTDTTDALELAVPINLIASVADELEKRVSGGDSL
jgi:hypothetical protein